MQLHFASRLQTGFSHREIRVSEDTMLATFRIRRRILTLRERLAAAYWLVLLDVPGIQRLVNARLHHGRAAFLEPPELDHLIERQLPCLRNNLAEKRLSTDCLI